MPGAFSRSRWGFFQGVSGFAMEVSGAVPESLWAFSGESRIKANFFHLPQVFFCYVFHLYVLFLVPNLGVESYKKVV